ncbi:hypothetical protein [Cellulosimicrobium sp. CUA-896]|uniref:hypothetical protein n=1 Tax=Cellulosimicrobium sp. CUA-896 TaxID=1517881 RepID=UPI001115376B|nr:hypothetical protein [Cellulosimicrobium sp. CUA-896]
MRIRNTISTTTTALATSALLVLGLAACGADGGETDDAAAEETTSTEAAEQSPAEEDSAEVEAEGAEDEGAQDGATDVCAATDTLEQLSTEMTSIDQDDPQAAIDTFEQLTTTLEDVEPPAEIADDWTTMATTFRSVTDGLSSALEDPSNPDAMSKVSDAMSAMTDESFQQAGQSVGAYTTANC